MSEGLEVKKATRRGIVPLIVLYSESGCGKTFSSLLMARGLAGRDGKVIMCDTENGRGELYADILEIGGYDVISLTSPFSPSRYIDAIELMQKSGAAVGIIDSGSHEWDSTEGVLDMAMENEEKSGKSGLHNWKKPKFEHAKFIHALMKSPIPLIVCLRAKFKTRQSKKSGKTEIIKDDFTSPIQAEDFIFEATCHGEIMPDHSLRLTKWSHPGLKACFPVNGPITVDTGKKIAQWCNEPGTKPEEKVPVKTETIDSVVESVMKGKKNGKDFFTIQAGGMEFVTHDIEIAKAGKKSTELSAIVSIGYRVTSEGNEIFAMNLPDGGINA